MKKNNPSLFGSLVLLVCLLALLIHSAQAQTGGGYDLTWNTLEGGGMPVSAGGDFLLTGTFGQADASAALSGGGFSLVGGFWSGAITSLLHLPVISKGD